MPVFAGRAGWGRVFDQRDRRISIALTWPSSLPALTVPPAGVLAAPESPQAAKASAESAASAVRREKMFMVITFALRIESVRLPIG